MDKQPGAYYDAIVNKRSRVICMIVESFGGITPQALAHLGHLARRAKGKGARDGTKYGRARTSTKSFFVHHTQRIAAAAVVGDTRALRKAVNVRKQARLGGRPADTARQP